MAFSDFIPQPQKLKRDFVSTTCRYVFYTLAMAAAGAWISILLAVPPMHPALSFTLMIGSLLVTLYYDKIARDPEMSFYALLFFGGITGLVIGPTLALIAANFVNGSLIIGIALAITALQTAGLWFYAWYKAKFTDSQISNMGAFLTMGLFGLIGLSLINFFFATPLSILFQSAIGIAIFSGFLVYDIYLVRTGKYETPVEAAVNIFLDIINLFLETLNLLLALENDNLAEELGNFIVYRIIPIVFIIACVFTFGLFEPWATEEKGQGYKDPEFQPVPKGAPPTYQDANAGKSNGSVPVADDRWFFQKWFDNENEQSERPAPQNTP